MIRLNHVSKIYGDGKMCIRDRLQRLQKYLDRTEREGMITREILVALRTDLTQVVYAWLSEREIKAYALFADADMENLHRNSLYGREEMMEYAGVLDVYKRQTCFCINLLDIGERYLGFSYEASGAVRAAKKLHPDSEALLIDILDAGSFGKSSAGRIHSANITLYAAERCV